IPSVGLHAAHLPATHQSAVRLGPGCAGEKGQNASTRSPIIARRIRREKVSQRLTMKTDDGRVRLMQPAVRGQSTGLKQQGMRISRLTDGEVLSEGIIIPDA